VVDSPSTEVCGESGWSGVSEVGTIWERGDVDGKGKEGCSEEGSKEENHQEEKVATPLCQLLGRAAAVERRSLLSAR